MGDVALTTPAIRGVLQDNPDLEITMVTPRFFAPFFYDIPRLTLFHPDFKGEHKGVKGLYKLYKKLSSDQDFDAIIDLHDVLRSRILSSFFKLKSKPVYRISKDRGQKKKIISGKLDKAIKPSWQRYADVFYKAGLKFTPSDLPCIRPSEEAMDEVNKYVTSFSVGHDDVWIGIAPFAKHDLKMWSLDSMRNLIDKICTNNKATIFLFGGGEKEKQALDKLSVGFDKVFNLTGKIDFKNELALIQKLDFMISMDSANMHIASLLGTKTVSVWCATHSMVGFSAYKQPDDYIIEVPRADLPCRPCTVYGKGTCKRGDLACRYSITHDDVYKRLVELKMLV